MSRRTVRLSAIPASVEESRLRQYLNSLERQTRSTEENILALSLAPHINWLVATVVFDQEPSIFLQCRHGQQLPLKLPAELGGVTIYVDCDFYGLTTLYYPPSEPKCDVVAVSGLSSHAFGSWKSPLESHVMWLRDILPLDFPYFRVLTWGYESDIRDCIATSSITDFSRQLLTAVHIARDDDGIKGLYRPLIFVGHSLGGLVIKQALVDASHGSFKSDRAILNSCIGLFLFGVPNRGLNNENMLSLVKGKKNVSFLNDLMEGSALIHDLHTAFLRSVKSKLSACYVTSFFETKDTQTVVNTPDGGLRRSGIPIRLVSQESATLCIPVEEAHNMIAISTDHSNLVKFTSRHDTNYLNVLFKIKEVVQKASGSWVRDQQELGRGAFGVVWRETCLVSNTVRAVKVIPKHDARLSPKMREREIMNFTALSEYPQYFVQFLESFEDEHSISIAMEYIQHGDLGKHLREPWKEAEAKLITIQLLEGVIIMHNFGITHRDLRPENILVASLSPLLIKIGDFGISKRVQNNDTALRTSCGAMDYAAPEIYIHRHPEYTNAVDIWSLGCVAHKILTGRTPFTNPDLWKYVYGSTEFPVQHLATKRISESGVEFIQCLMEKDPGTRLSAEQARKAAWLNVVEEA